MSNILVVGAGATGGYFGTRLAQADRRVTFLVSPKRAALLRRRGLRLLTADGLERIEPRIRVTGDELETADVVLVAVKDSALLTAVSDFAPAVGESTHVVPFLNGMRHLESLDDRFGVGRVLGAVAKVVTQLTSDGDVQQLAPGASLEVGQRRNEGQASIGLDPGTGGGDGVGPRNGLDAVAQLLDVPGFTFTMSSTITSAMWHKWVFIASIGAATALLGGNTGMIAAAQGGSAVGERIVEEAAAVSAAAAQPLSRGQIEAIASVFRDSGSGVTSSLSRDLTAGRPTEVEAVLGDMVSRAHQAGVDVPLLTAAAVRLRVHEQHFAG